MTPQLQNKNTDKLYRRGTLTADTSNMTPSLMVENFPFCPSPQIFFLNKFLYLLPKPEINSPKEMFI